jgi:hypothetical protein
MQYGASDIKLNIKREMALELKLQNINQKMSLILLGIKLLLKLDTTKQGGVQQVVVRKLMI